MRASFAAMVGLALFATACSSSTNTTTTTTGGLVGATTGGGTLPPGSSCTYNGACVSGICDLTGSGNCCLSACVTGDATCGATGCDSSGTCIYPQPSVSCGSSCAASTVTPSNCDGSGTCQVGATGPCANNYGCNHDGGCNSTCTGTSQCASGFVCNGGACGVQIQNGTCTENDDCKSGVCGVKGTGNCCAAACLVSDANCGALACALDGGACIYPDAGTSCGPGESCAAGTQTLATICDGLGSCPNPATAPCDPFVCGPTACLTKCTTTPDCTAGDFCDAAHGGCCTGLNSLGSISVDGATGSDAACCGIGGKNPCLTISHAMELIDSASAQNVTITATVNGAAGGNWPTTETYPIVLGWGADLKAAGVYFSDADGDAGSHPAIFDIKPYSANDMLGSASIEGTQASAVWIGMDVTGKQSKDAASIKIEAGGQLSISNASVNGSASNATTAILVQAGGALSIGQNGSGFDPGALTIGNNAGDPASDGYAGIVCGSTATTGCTITDAPVSGGSLFIEGQEQVDIDAEDNAAINLTYSPSIGAAPAQTGFMTCATKSDAIAKNGPAILLHGAVTMTFEGNVQCISGDGFDLTSSAVGVPNLTLKKTTIQNTELGIHAFAGTATVSSSTIEYNYNGVEQDSDKTHTGTINLNGGATVATATTVACANSAESALGGGLPGVAVLNTTSAVLNASNVFWDTSGPDVFMCNNALASCVCESSGCSTSPGTDGMDAVYESTGLITTSGNSFSNLDCTVGFPCNGQTCSGGEVCCATQFSGCFVCDDSMFCIQDCE